MPDLPPVVSDPEVCHLRTMALSREVGQAVIAPHDWDERRPLLDTTEATLSAPTFEVCRYCGGRKPDEVDDWPPRDSRD